MLIFRPSYWLFGAAIVTVSREMKFLVLFLVVRGRGGIDVIIGWQLLLKVKK